jgi:hypothetical protein
MKLNAHFMMPCRYRLLAQIIVDEKRIMRMNVFRFESFHGSWEKYHLHEYLFSLPKTLKEFEDATRWTHIMSARFTSAFCDPFDSLSMHYVTLHS